MTMTGINAKHEIREEQFECPTHGAYRSKVIYFNGARSPNFTRPPCPLCTKTLAEAEAKRRAEEKAEQAAKDRVFAAEQRRKAVERALKSSAIPAEYVGKTFDDFKVTAEKKDERNAETLRQARLYVERFSSIRSEGVGLFFWGPAGTGKSHLACAILQALMPEVDGVYCMTWQVIKAVKSAPFGVDALEPFMDVSLLVLDEVGVQVGSKYEETILYPLIEHRIAHKLPTIFITNLQPDAKDPSRYDGTTLRQIVGERIWDRMQYRSIFLKTTGESKRKRFDSVDALLCKVEVAQ